jgi:hypothetical protein
MYHYTQITFFHRYHDWDMLRVRGVEQLDVDRRPPFYRTQFTCTYFHSINIFKNYNTASTWSFFIGVNRVP